VSARKNDLVDHESALAQAETPVETSYAEAYREYQRRLLAANALDFDDLIMTTVHLLQAYPDLREQYRRRFRHVLVDEYQDTNHAQYVLVRELCADDPDAEPRPDGTPRIEPPELMVVGDSDQSIYAFRGATIRNINDFESDFPGAAVIMLEQNYRSTQNILNAANAVITKNTERKPKNLWSDAGDGALITGYVADTEHDEAQFVAGRDRAAAPGRGRPVRRRRGLLPDQRPVPDVRGGVHPARPAVQGGRRRPLLRAARGPGRDRVPAHHRQPDRRRLAAPHPQRAQAGDRRPREAAVAEWATKQGLSFGEALRRIDEIPGWPPGRPTSCAGSPPCWTARGDGRRRACPPTRS
jgi:DNA helicase-2/ATP-dependent DNA helicase PcrA